MNRRTAILVGSLIAALALVELIALSGLMASERRDDRARYKNAITDQRRSAGRVGAQQPGPQRSTTVSTIFCVHRVDTFAATVSALHRDLLGPEQRLDVADFRELSNQAVRAQRYVEQANAGPALPQRMGRRRVAAAQPGEKPTWEPIAPAQIDCDDSDAYARFRLDLSVEDKASVGP